MNTVDDHQDAPTTTSPPWAMLGVDPAAPFKGYATRHVKPRRPPVRITAARRVRPRSRQRRSGATRCRTRGPDDSDGGPGEGEPHPARGAV